MSPEAAQASHTATGFPRVSGDEPTRPQAYGELILFSPRERG